MTTEECGIPVLLVGDSPDDRLFIKIYVQKSRMLKIVGEVYDGLEAIDYLLGNGCFVDRAKYPLPSIIVLDLKMPRMNGFEILECIRREYSFRFPVIMMSGSWLQQDIDKSLKLGATAYFKKATTRAEQIKMIESIEKLATRQNNLN